MYTSLIIFGATVSFLSAIGGMINLALSFKDTMANMEKVFFRHILAGCGLFTGFFIIFVGLALSFA